MVKLFVLLAESYLQSLATINGLAAAAEQQQVQSPSSPAARPSNSVTPNSANDESSAVTSDKTSNGTDVSRDANVNAMIASAMQQFLQQQQYFNNANAWFGSQFLQKQTSPAGPNAFVFPPPGLAAFMPNASMAIGADPSSDSTNGSNNILSAFLAANPITKVEKSEDTETSSNDRKDEDPKEEGTSEQ